MTISLSVRQPMFWLLTIFGTIAMFLSIFIPYFTFGEDLKMVKEITYALTMIFPAIFASFALVFADVIDDFVTVRYLSGASNTETLSVKIYGAVRSTPTPAYNAAATFMLAMTVVGLAIVYVVYKICGREQGGSATSFVVGQL